MDEIIKLTGSNNFRQRIVLSTLSQKEIEITKIRIKNKGILDYEANFLRMIETFTKGTKIEINENGTALRYKPGIIIGGVFSHTCSKSRGMGYYLEGKKKK
jgi:RNA 3'-terminal phosphate cyclase-like protein